MKLRLIPALAVMLLLPGCDDEDSPYSGTITLDNVLYESGSYYYALGLSFEEGSQSRRFRMQSVMISLYRPGEG